MPTLPPFSAAALTPLLCSIVLIACQPTSFDDAGTADEGGDPTSGGDDTTGGDGDSGDGDSGDGDGGEPVLKCDPGEDMPCPEGQKCTVLGNGAPPVYDCVNDDSSLLPFDPCVTEPGTGQDQCPVNHACVPFEPGGADGLCLELCLDDNDCEASRCTEPPGQFIPVCAPLCDPLGPLCAAQQECQRVDKTSFVCQFPREGDVGITAEACNIEADSGCAEGFVCETGQIVSGCVSPSCCTSLCDLSEPDPCEAPMSCNELDLDPLPLFDTVGACYVPQ